jgi:serine/threonine protein kinase
MIVMCKVENGDLRDNLLTKKYNPNDKFYNLYLISLQLAAMHKLNLIHGDIHDGNILYLDHATVLLCDFGLCRSADQPSTEIFGVLPYMAPEILRGKPYTTATDIYSFGMIMWEMTSGIPVFNDYIHDSNFAKKVCDGLRPEIIEGTIPEYADLVKKCWDNDPEKRPTVEELKNFFYEWSERYPIEINEEMRTPIPGSYNLFLKDLLCFTNKFILFYFRK